MNRKEVEERIQKILSELPHSECRTCECFLGYITQLELDAKDNVSDLTAPLKIPRSRMHSCLGCTPCPPADAFAPCIKPNRGSK